MSAAASQLAFVLYLPLLGALGYLVVLCGWLLARGQTEAAWGALYAAALAALARRAWGVARGEKPAARVEIALLLAVNALLAVLLLGRIL